MAKVKFNIKELITESIKTRYEKLNNEKSTVLNKARDCALLTIPSVLPKDGYKEGDTIDTPYQSLGAKLVNALASKLIMTLVPPNNSFFRLFPTTEIAAKLDDKTMEEANNIAVMAEKEAQKVIETQSIRVTSFELFKSLIITGNALAVKTKETLKSYRYDQYVILRDYEGNPLEIITVEKVDPDTLDPPIVENLQLTADEDCSVYTRAVLRNKVWYEYQYINDLLVEGSETQYNPDKFPYMPLRWTGINGNNYGIGLVEQYLGDFRSLEACYQMLIENAAVAGKTVFGLKPGSILDISDLATANNGDVIQGDFEADLTVMRVDKGSDIQYVQQVAETLQRRLEQAFLSASSVARESERTTAREISYMAADLEQSLGGVYSILSQEFQAPLARLILTEIKVDFGTFDYVTVTGIDALGRNNDLEKLMQFTQVLQATGLQEALASRMNIDNLINDLTTASGLQTGRYIKSSEQVAAEQQQAQQDQIAQQGFGAIAQGAGQGLGKAMTQPQQ